MISQGFPTFQEGLAGCIKSLQMLQMYIGQEARKAQVSCLRTYLKPGKHAHDALVDSRGFTC